MKGDSCSLLGYDTAKELGLIKIINTVSATTSQTVADELVQKYPELFVGIGMLKNLQDFASISAPLRELTRKDTPWHWKPEHATALQTIKDSLTCNMVMLYFDPAKDTELVVEASPVSLGAIIYQKNLKGERHTIAYASRALSDVERRYSQTEKEALAIVWSELCVNIVCEYATPKAMTLNEIKEETLKDHILQKVCTHIRDNTWHRITDDTQQAATLKKYRQIKRELTVSHTDDIILRVCNTSMMFTTVTCVVRLPSYREQDVGIISPRELGLYSCMYDLYVDNC
ncbi:hypothetical protein F2P79_016372 [Pimephales promelas]|nr:hypothetical protein F2P79_016372 [Pimephales promelas]